MKDLPNKGTLLKSLEEEIKKQKSSMHESIDFFCKPVRLYKKIQEENKEDSNKNDVFGQVISFDSQEEIKVGKIEYNYFFEGDIDSLCVSALWLGSIGRIIDNTLDDNIYANRINNSSNFFKPYFSAYSDYRNSSFSQMKSIIDENKTGIYIQLDLEACFYNIDLKKLENEVNKILDNYFKTTNIEQLI